jgi:hypothetical protein
MPRLTGRTERIRIGRQGHRPGLQAYTRSSSRWMDLESKRITCYRDATGDLLVLPWAKVGYGGKATSHLRRLPSDAGSERLGRLVRDQTSFCDQSFCDPTVTNPLLSTTGLKTMRAFANRWSSVVIYFDDDKIRISPTSRDSKGAYWELFRESASLPLDSSDGALGDRIREAFAACKLGRRDH